MGSTGFEPVTSSVSTKRCHRASEPVSVQLKGSNLHPGGVNLRLSPLTSREQEVLRLVAAGHPTREVARRLCYSERTIKNVIHDVVTKLNARTRSQAVAEAVREGLI